MRKVRTHRLNGVKYYLDIDGNIEGWCDKPKEIDPHEYPGIKLASGLPYGNEKGAKFGLITLIHECLHAENWSKYENAIDRTATDIGALLWRLGYRRKKMTK